MKWLMKWAVDAEDGGRPYIKEQWATSWEEAVGHFTSWISKASDVIKGEITCYWGEEPFGDGKPCLYFNVTDGEPINDEDEEE